MTKKVIKPHSTECYYATGKVAGRKPNDEWVLPRHEWLELDILGRRTRHLSRGFVIFRCNCADCGAELAIPFEHVHKALFK